MNRLLSAIKTDVLVQWRNKLYAIGIGVGALVAIGLATLAAPRHMHLVIPALMLIVIGGSTMLYVAGMVLFERDEGTLNAVMVSPLRPSEYLWSKIVTLTALATLESTVMIGGAMLLVSWSQPLVLPNVPLLLTGIMAIGIIYTLIGAIMIVRYHTLTDFLIPMAGVAIVLQLPFLHFLGVVVHPLFLVIPTSAPTVLMQGAYRELASWEWWYAVSYTAALIMFLTAWSFRAFHKHVVTKAG